MPSASAPESLRTGQYRDASRLDARIELHRRFSVNPQGWMPWLFEQLDFLAPEADLLELGCGAATLWLENADRIPPGWRVQLSDFSEGMLADARNRLAAVDHAFRFEAIDATAVGGGGERFDCVLANHMLYHVADRPRALAEIHRVLRPGGRLFASTLSGDTMLEVGALVRNATDRVKFRQMRQSRCFGLENGAGQLAPFFYRIERRLFEDALEITETAQLIAYLESMILDEPFREDELAAVGELVQQEINQAGVFRVRKSAGVFVATRL